MAAQRTIRSDARSGRISKDPDVRRIEIMTTALQLFTRNGYDSTSVQTITASVGVAKGLFYHYFDSKADLVDQIAEWQAEAFLATLPRHAAEMDGEALEKIRQVIGRIVQWKFEDVRGLTFAYLRVMYRDDNVVLRNRLIREYTYRLVPLFAEIIAEADEAGICDAGNPEIAAELVFATWIGSGERVATMMLALPAHPERVGALLDRIRAWEWAIERILGIQEGELRLYDYEYLGKVLADVAAMDPQDSLDFLEGDAS